ncbi:MAG: hypothetical protein Q8Q39_01270 [bacterium]|nr:hypothetical protein [bacterium]
MSSSPNPPPSHHPDQNSCETEEAAKAGFRAYRRQVYHLLPDDCLLKPRGWLSVPMLAFDPRLLRKKWIGQQDICSLCMFSACPWNKAVTHRTLRGFKIFLLQKLFRSWFITNIFTSK